MFTALDKDLTELLEDEVYPQELPIVIIALN
jgi:hypothetical protein